jgi:hypothetical protein
MMQKQRIMLIGTLVTLMSCSSLQTSSTSVETGTRSLSSVKSCLKNPSILPLFNILENNQQQITVELGDFASFFQLDSDLYYHVYYKGSKENKNEAEVILSSGALQSKNQRVVVPVQKTGVYTFVIFENEKSPVWKQKVFAIAKTEHTLSAEDRKALAEKYAPVVSQHHDELYFPVSFEYLTNQVEVDSDLNNEPFLLTNKKVQSFFSFGSEPTLDFKFKFADINQVMAYYGHSESVLKSDLDFSADTRLKSRFGQKNVTVYYSVFENPKWKEIYINYHFFYSYDPKNGTPGNDVIAAHIFDRESMTVVLRSTSRQPLSVFYGAHLASQTMGQLDASGNALQKWNSGRVFVNWPEVIKMNGRPVPAIALGSHAVYPKRGEYAVFFNNFKLLVEPAGGDRMLYPQFMSDYRKTANSYSYELKDLGLDHVTSACDNPYRFLAFSGSTVDVLGPVNATFPPYTDREEDYFSYNDPNAPLFDMKK